jgi:F-type H+-transporting ATPase subunit b
MYLIKRFLFKPVLAILEKRRAMADAQIQDAKKAKEEAENMKAGYEADMAKAKETATAMMQNAERDAAARSEAIISEAQSQAANIKAKAEADIIQEKKKAVNDIKNEIGGIAMDIAGKVIEREISEEDHKKLINEFIENVGEAS